MQKLFLIIILVVAAASTFAQKQSKKERRDQKHKRIDALIKQEEEGVVAYKKHTVFGGKLTSNGYGAFVEFGRMKTVKKGVVFQLELSEYKSVKEEKRSNFSGSSYSTPYTFGKQNFFYPVKLGMQQQVLFGNKSNKNGVSITGNFGGGISMGLLRPYYVQRNGSNDYIKYYPDSSNTEFLNPVAIGGGPGLGKGWKEIKVTPGAYVKTALRFDYGSYNEVVSALEVGIVADFYSKKIPIMVHEKQKQFFFSGYVSILFGRRR